MVYISVVVFQKNLQRNLQQNEIAKDSIRKAIAKGMPTLAECGGFMYLTKSIENTSGEKYPMVGFIPGKVKMQKKLAALGYREISERRRIS